MGNLESMQAEVAEKAAKKRAEEERKNRPATEKQINAIRKICSSFQIPLPCLVGLTITGAKETMDALQPEIERTKEKWNKNKK